MAEVRLKEQELKLLLGSGSGDACLLYLHIKSTGALTLSEAAETLHMDARRIDSAIALLGQLGLIAAPAGSLAPQPEVRRYSEQDVVSAQRSDPKFKLLVGEAQRRLGRTLSGEELKTLLGLRDYLRLPTEVIGLLIHYCIQRSRSRGRTRMPSMRAIEQEGYTWADQGIDSRRSRCCVYEPQLTAIRRRRPVSESARHRGPAPDQPARSATCSSGRSCTCRTRSSPWPMSAPVSLSAGSNGPIWTPSCAAGTRWACAASRPSNRAMSSPNAVVMSTKTASPLTRAVRALSLRLGISANLWQNTPATSNVGPSPGFSAERRSNPWGYSSEVMRQARLRLKDQRRELELLSDRQRSEAYEADPHLRVLDLQLRSTVAQVMASAFQKRENPQEALDAARKRNLAAQAERSRILKRLRLPDYLDTDAPCPHCGGTGWARTAAVQLSEDFLPPGTDGAVCRFAGAQCPGL